MNMNSQQTVNREEYHRLDNRVNCILQQRWPTNEISQWVGLLKGKQQAVASANRPTVPVHSTDGRPIGRRHIVEGLAPVAIDQSGTIRCAVTGRPLFIAPGSSTDRANPGVAEQLNPRYQPALHQVVADHRKHIEAVTK